MADSGLRKIFLLQNLPRFPRKIDTQTLKQRCELEGFPASLRTIQRDLNDLSQHFPLLADEASPQGWSLSADEVVIIPGMDLSTAISFALAEEHLSGLLPGSVKARLQPHFTQAKRYLSAEAANPISHWPDKVKVIAPGLPMLPAQLCEQVTDIVYGALLRERTLRIRYRSRSGGDTKEYLVHPHGLVAKAGYYYLIACFEGYDDLRQLALSRIEQAEELPVPAKLTPDFSLGKYVEAGGVSLMESDRQLQLRLRIDPALITHLTETPLAANQQIEAHPKGALITASVADTQELRWWLLGLGERVEVLEPDSLRQELARTISNMANIYESKGDTLCRDDDLSLNSELS